ncbi:MAG: metallophosphoesterase [Clostridiales bacterium]
MNLLYRSFFGLIILSILVAIYGLLEPRLIEIKNNEILRKDIPKKFNNYKIAFISDIHYNNISSESHMRNVVKKVNALNPDIILLGGDYTDSDEKYIDPVFNILKGLKAKDGVYGVIGNHDFYKNCKDKTLESMEKSDIKSLDNEGVWIKKSDEKIRIGGVGDYWHDAQLPENTTEPAKKDDFILLVSHNPDYVEELKDEKVDLILSGHTHGGQITFFGLYAPKIPSYYGQKYKTGLIKTGKYDVIVSNGIGYIGLPIRFFAKPQINLIELKKI